MQNAYRSGPTLETIPTELKLMIASHLDPDVPLDLRWSEIAQREARTCRAALAALSLISRSWAAALEDLRWQTLRLCAADTRRLLELARDYMPRCGFKVKELVIVWWTVDNVSDVWDRTDLPSDPQLEASERFIGLNPLPDQPLQRVFDVSDVLIATILRACAKLRHFKVVNRMTTRCFKGNEGSKVTITSSRTENALQELGGKISSATLFFGRDYSLATGYLNMMPNIEQLSIHIDDNASVFGLPDLFLRISKLPKLVSLELSPAIPTLTHLTLFKAFLLQCAELDKILKLHPVTSLSLGSFALSTNQFPMHVSPPGRTEVKNLCLNGWMDDALLNLFDAAPLEHVELYTSRDGDSVRANPQRIKAFIIKHRASLLTFKTDPNSFHAEDVSAINRSLEHEGIFVRVVTVK